jgi:hypothetical protein
MAMTILTATFRNRLTHLALALLTVALLAPAPVLNAQPGGAGQGNADAHRDPCEQSLQPPGNANGLHRRCEGQGGGGGVARGDFNGDGLADLAVGVPFEDQDGINAVGGVNIIYASATGLSATADLFLDETDFGFPYASDDHFGWALASGDFDGDTFADLAIGMPDGDLGKTLDIGRVFLIDGSSSGLDLATARQFVLLPSARTAGANAGEALVWADFNGDGFGDLAVGAPGVSLPAFCANLVGYAGAGEVQVFYGGPSGLTQLGAQRLFQKAEDSLCGSNGGIGSFTPRARDRFGTALAAGNFNGDVSNDRPVFDLVIGTPLDDLDQGTLGGLPLPIGSIDEGVVLIVPGSVNGLNGAQTQSLSQDTPGIGGGAEEGDQFGRALAVGDFNADLRDDLAIGVPFEDLLDNTAADAGAVHVLFGSFAANELVTTIDSRFISQTNLSGSAAEAGDRFGWALATGRFNNDFRADLAIGSPGEDIDTIANAGIVQVLYGEAAGPSLTFTQLWRQGANGIPDAAESGDQFGYALSAWNYGRSTHSDLAIGVPFEDLVSGGSQIADAGAVILIYGSFTNLSSTTINPAEFWHQNVSGIDDVAQPGDRFGHALY